jgi:hypothetical protein
MGTNHKELKEHKGREEHPGRGEPKGSEQHNGGASNPALKGRDIEAQGTALGRHINKEPSPEGAK